VPFGREPHHGLSALKCYTEASAELQRKVWSRGGACDNIGMLGPDAVEMTKPHSPFDAPETTPYRRLAPKEDIPYRLSARGISGVLE
jgi:hypothetical protein